MTKQEVFKLLFRHVNYYMIHPMLYILSKIEISCIKICLCDGNSRIIWYKRVQKNKIFELPSLQLVKIRLNHHKITLRHQYSRKCPINMQKLVIKNQFNQITHPKNNHLNYFIEIIFLPRQWSKGKESFIQTFQK